MRSLSKVAFKPGAACQKPEVKHPCVRIPLASEQFIERAAQCCETRALPSASQTFRNFVSSMTTSHRVFFPLPASSASANVIWLIARLAGQRQTI
jgi:hypothetical protein